MKRTTKNSVLEVLTTRGECIDKSLRMSLRDIRPILRKHGLSHGITTTTDNNDNKFSDTDILTAF
jgi:hypothetical protein